jgi:hypothetical protein
MLSLIVYIGGGLLEKIVLAFGLWTQLRSAGVRLFAVIAAIAVATLPIPGGPARLDTTMRSQLVRMRGLSKSTFCFGLLR